MRIRRFYLHEYNFRGGRALAWRAPRRYEYYIRTHGMTRGRWDFPRSYRLLQVCQGVGVGRLIDLICVGWCACPILACVGWLLCLLAGAMPSRPLVRRN